MSKNPFLGLGFSSSLTSFARQTVVSGIECSTLPSGRYLDLSAKKTGSITNQETTPRGVFVGDSGNKMYVTGASGDGVDQYSLSTPWDPSTASHDAFENLSEVGGATDIFFSSDGTRFYILDADGNFDGVQQYTMSTAWDVTSASYASLQGSLGFGNKNDDVTGLTFSADGVYMYVMSSYLRYMNRFTLSTPWDASTAGSRVQDNFYSSQITATGQETGCAIDPTGTRFVIVHVQGDEIEEYTFASAHDIAGTVSHVGSLSISSDTTFPSGCCWGDNGRYFYVVSSAPNDEVIRYETCTGGAYKILGRP